MANPEIYHNSKPADRKLREALLPEEVGMVHGVLNNHHPRYEENLRRSEWAKSSVPSEPFLSDGFVIPPSKRIVEVKRKLTEEKPKWVNTSDERKKHIAAVKEVLKNGTRQRGGIQETLNAKQIERREIDLHRLESAEKHGRRHNTR